MSNNPKKSAHIVRNFRDAGTEQEFKAGATVEIEAGAFANYAAAGLVREPTSEAADDEHA